MTTDNSKVIVGGNDEKKSYTFYSVYIHFDSYNVCRACVQSQQTAK